VSGLSKWVLGAIFALVLGICLVGAALAIATDDSGNVDVNLGDDEFRIDNVAGFVDDAPLPFNDVANGTRPILVVHRGDEPLEGWTVFLAIEPGTEACVVNWDQDDEVFRDCEGDTYPADGTGLDEVASRIDGEALVVDLGRGGGTTTTTP